MKENKDKGLILYDKVFQYNLTMTQRFIFSLILYYYKKKKITEIDENLINIITNKLNVDKRTIKSTLNILIKKDLLNNNYTLRNSIFNEDKKSYIYISYDILNNNDLTALEKVILSYLNSFIRKNKNCRVSNETISNNLFISKDIVKKSIYKLKKLGFIKTTFEKQGFITKNREIYIDKDNLHNLYIKCVERIETEKIEKIKRVEEIKTEKISLVEKIENINNIETLNYTSISMIDYLTSLSKIKIPKEEAMKIYFDKKREFELAKEIYNNAKNI